MAVKEFLVDEAAEEAVVKGLREMLRWMLDPKAIDGALKSCIHAHGPVNRDNSFSAAKRVRGAMLTRSEEYLQRRAEVRGEALDAD